MTTSPLIGITVDSEEPGAYSNKPWFALRQNYCEAVAKAGGTVLMLPHDVDAAERYADLLDGLVVSGGNFDVDPALFGPVVVSPDILRGPLPNAWSHRDRLEANRAAIWKDTVSAGKYLDRAEPGSKITGIVICMIFLSLVTTCVYKEATRPIPEEYRVVQ